MAARTPTPMPTTGDLFIDAPPSPLNAPLASASRGLWLEKHLMIWSKWRFTSDTIKTINSTRIQRILERKTMSQSASNSTPSFPSMGTNVSDQANKIENALTSSFTLDFESDEPLEVCPMRNNGDEVCESCQ